MSSAGDREHEPGPSSVPFPTSNTEQSSNLQGQCIMLTLDTGALTDFAESESSSSNQTSSDKLSALPTQSSPPLGRLRSPSRLVRRSIDISGSLSSMDSPGSAIHQSLHQPSGCMRASESEGSLEVGTMRGRQSVESDRASLPATLQGIKQGKPRSWIIGRGGGFSLQNASGEPQQHSAIVTG